MSAVGSVGGSSMSAPRGPGKRACGMPAAKPSPWYAAASGKADSGDRLPAALGFALEPRGEGSSLAHEAERDLSAVAGQRPVGERALDVQARGAGLARRERADERVVLLRGEGRVVAVHGEAGSTGGQRRGSGAEGERHLVLRERSGRHGDADGEAVL